MCAAVHYSSANHQGLNVTTLLLLTRYYWTGRNDITVWPCAGMNALDRAVLLGFANLSVNVGLRVIRQPKIPSCQWLTSDHRTKGWRSANINSAATDEVLSLMLAPQGREVGEVAS